MPTPPPMSAFISPLTQSTNLNNAGTCFRSVFSEVIFCGRGANNSSTVSNLGGGAAALVTGRAEGFFFFFLASRVVGVGRASVGTTKTPSRASPVLALLSCLRAAASARPASRARPNSDDSATPSAFAASRLAAVLAAPFCSALTSRDAALPRLDISLPRTPIRIPSSRATASPSCLMYVTAACEGSSSKFSSVLFGSACKCSITADALASRAIFAKATCAFFTPDFAAFVSSAMLP